MPYRKDKFGIGECYHVFNRGANKQSIFYSAENYNYITKLLMQHSQKHHIGIICYCWMPNHYHLLLRQEATASISVFMKSMFTAYTLALNLQQGRSGTLFEGRFKHILIDKQRYLSQLIQYIHLNPVVAGLVRKPEGWKYSDYSYWIDNFPESILNLPESFKLSGSSINLNEWHHRRIQFYKNEYDLLVANEYQKYIGEFWKEKVEDLKFRRYLFD
ncbi:MAG: transposase [Ignavibacteriales bacterium]|nr:transposase [Ignavibacteriales bacterium]